MIIKSTYSLLFINFFFMLPLTAQKLTADRTVICKGESTPVTLTMEDAPIGFQATYIWDSEECTHKCSTMVLKGSKVEGAGIVSQTNPPSISCSEEALPVYNLVCKVRPTTTTTYTYTYDVITTYSAVSDEECNQELEEVVSINEQTAEITIEVLDIPVPDLSNTKTTVYPGETIKLSVANCPNNYGVAIKSELFCTEIGAEYNNRYNCASLINAGIAPNQPTTIDYEVQIYLTPENGVLCTSLWENISITVLPPEELVDNCPNVENLLTDYANKKETSEGVYAHQYSCLAAKTCEEYAKTGENGWAGGFVKYSFDWMEDRVISGSNVPCSNTGIWGENFICFGVAGETHLQFELKPLFFDYCKQVNTQEDIDRWRANHEDFLNNAVSSCFEELEQCDELESWQAATANKITLTRLRLVRATAIAFCELKKFFFTGQKNTSDFIQSIPDRLTKADLYSTELAENNILNINESKFFLSIGESLDLQVAPIDPVEEGVEVEEISYALTVSEDIATVSTDGILTIHSTPRPIRNSSAILYVVAAQGDKYAIGQYAIYEEDTDNDGIVDAYETKVGLNPTVTNEFDSDLDQDGLTDFLEVMLNTNPLVQDTDDDGYTDGQEYTADTDPLDKYELPCETGSCYKDCERALAINDIEHNGYHAKQIVSNAQVQENRHTQFEATQDITLRPGFHAQSGSTFLATISNCQVDNSSTENLPTNSLSRSTEANISFDSPALTIFPNPTSGAVNIQLYLSTAQKITCTIFDITGKKEKEVLNNQLLDRGTHHFSTSLNPGVYLLKCLNGKDAFTKKLIVQ